MNIILSMTLSGSIVFIVYSLFEHIRFVRFSPRNRYFILKAILFFHFIPMGYLSRKFSGFVLSRFGHAYKDTFVNGSKPAVIFAPDERYINAAYKNHTAIICIWLLIAVLIFLRAISARHRLKNLILHSAKEITDEARKQILTDCQRRLNIKKKIRIYSANAKISAFTYGLIHPMIVVPEKYGTKELELTILHELAHIKRKDSFILFLRTLTMGIYWFNPLIYSICRKTNTLCELACDELVVENIKDEDRRNYSNLIIAAAVSPHLTSRHITPFSKNQNIIKERIDLIMADKKRKNKLRLIPLALSAGILLTSTIPALAYEPPKELTVLDSSNTEELLSSVSNGNFAEFTVTGLSDNAASVPVKHIKYDFQFTDKNGNIYPADMPSGQADCNHTFINGTFTTHIRNDNGGCTLKNYDAKRCTKCGGIADRKLVSTHTYITCPH